jgi:hypothetical protein
MFAPTPAASVISVTMVNNGARQSLRRTCFNWLVTEFILDVSQFVSQVGIRGCPKGQDKIRCITTANREQPATGLRAPANKSSAALFSISRIVTKRIRPLSIYIGR